MYGVPDELSEKIDQNTFAIKLLNQNIDSVANNLDAHRRDTQVHRGYQVREEQN